MSDTICNNREIQVVDKQSLVHLGSLDSFDITVGGRKCARLILSYLRCGNKKKLNSAIEIYEKLIPNENFGGEYTALEWCCKLMLAPKNAREDMLKVPLVRGFWEVLSRNRFENLKTYLKYKYHIVEYKKNSDNIELKAKVRFLEDFILFNNPDRERWETTRENMAKLELKEGMKVADIGCGPGYFTFKFADLVGQTGKVYATETNPRHLEFLRDYVQRYDVKNVEVLEGSFEGIGLDPSIKVDVVYICSLYHNVYAAFTDEERESFVGGIRNALNDGGRLIVVDNDLVTGTTLPYHGPYINKQLLIHQLWYYGFKNVGVYQFTPQRYVLIFDKVDIPQPLPPVQSDSLTTICVNSASSLVRYRIIGTATSGYTARGKVFGRLMHQGLMEQDSQKLLAAQQGFQELWPKERIGDDYTAFIWFIKYYLATEEEKAAMAEDKLTATYLNYFAGNNYERLKTYLYYKFDLAVHNEVGASIDTNFEYSGTDFSIGRLNRWNEYLIFNNPNRIAWEKTDEMLQFCNIQPGQSVADIGCGGGYFTWQFAKMVGPAGHVYATEINDSALNYLTSFTQEHNIQNISTIVAKMNDACLAENSVDVIFMCSMYHAVYITDIEFVKDQFIASLHKALKKDGKIIIVDNNITEPGIPHYYGPGIKPELIISQLKYYGFELKAKWDVIPQRYALVFQVQEGYIPPETPEKEKNQRSARKNNEDRLFQVLRRKRKFSLRNNVLPQGPEDGVFGGD